MTLDPRPAPLTALAILEADGKQIEPLLRDTDPLAGPEREVGLVSADSWKKTLTRVGKEASGFLEIIEIGGVLVAGWRRYDELITAARVSRTTMEAQRVDLGGRTVSLRQHPRVDVTWGERTVASVLFEVVLAIRVLAVTGIVRGGSLVSIDSGRCEADVSLETKAVKREILGYSFDPRLVVGLGDGIRLVD